LKKQLPNYQFQFGGVFSWIQWFLFRCSSNIFINKQDQFFEKLNFNCKFFWRWKCSRRLY
jgi:hypothetical protein